MKGKEMKQNKRGDRERNKKESKGEIKGDQRKE